jgi:Zn-dependent M28 family amino/carboxypeptidase
VASKICFSLALGLLLAVAAAARAQSVRYVELPRDVIEERLRQYAGPDPARGANVKKLFREAGCSGEHLAEQPVARASAPNVLCILPGDSRQVILVGAHFDHAPEGEGVADNWSGASLLPSLYQSLNSAPRRHTFVFVSFTDEEKGFSGSRAYADRLTKDELAQVQAMINLDTLGLGPSKVWVSDSDPGLVQTITDLAARLKLPLGGMNVDGAGDSDGRSFKDRGIPIITLHSVTPETLNILHTGKDALPAIDLDAYYDSYKLITAYLATLDSAPEK